MNVIQNPLLVMKSIRLTFDSGEVTEIKTRLNSYHFINNKYYSTIQPGRLHKCINAEEL